MVLKVNNVYTYIDTGLRTNPEQEDRLWGQQDSKQHNNLNHNLLHATGDTYNICLGIQGKHLLVPMACTGMSSSSSNCPRSRIGNRSVGYQS